VAPANPTPNWQPLVDAALAVRGRAYAPYSNYRVGAAVLAPDGQVFAGCNVENASYGACLCAERVAIGNMVAHGVRALSACVVVTEGETPGSPCGICRQVLAEFASDCPILLIAERAGGDILQRTTSLAKLLPDPFKL